MAYFKILPQHTTEENHKEPQTEQLGLKTMVQSTSANSYPMTLKHVL
jgi:hypothetical protein